MRILIAFLCEVILCQNYSIFTLGLKIFNINLDVCCYLIDIILKLGRNLKYERYTLS
jgi:hypothetical protein